MEANRYPLTLYFDGACPLCRAEMHNLMRLNTAQRLRFVDIAAAGFEVPEGHTLVAMQRVLHAQAADGGWLRGVDTFVAMYEAVGVSWVVRALSAPGLRPLADRLYPWVARHRHWAPRWLVRLVFERAQRAAAKQAVPACAEGVCRRDAS